MSEKLLPDWREHIPYHIRVSDKPISQAAAPRITGRPPEEEITSFQYTKIEKLLDEGVFHHEIAKRIGVKVSTVSRLSREI